MQATTQVSEVGANYRATLFLVDDEPAKSGFTERRLRDLNMKKEVAESIPSARRKIRGVVKEASEGKPVVVVLDLMFPSDPRDGIQFLKEIRSGTVGVPPDLPVIVNTAVGDPYIKDAAIRLGVDDYIVKGTDPKKLDEAIQRAVGNEFLEASVLCEVIGVDTLKEIVWIRLRGEDGWVAERELDIGLCPIEARLTGGSFLLETYVRRATHRKEFVVRTKSVDPGEEEAVLRDLLADEEAP